MMNFRIAIRRPLLLVITLLAMPPALADLRVVVLGVTADMDMVERWAEVEDASLSESVDARSFRIDEPGVTVVVPSPAAPLSSIATALYQADAAVVVMDATQGPLPNLRDHVIVARQARVAFVAMMLANVDSLWELAPEDAHEFLDLEEQEFQSVLSLYEMGGADTPLFHDTAQAKRAPISATGGLAAIGKYFSNRGSTRSAVPDLDSQRNAVAQVYFLADAESNGYSITRAKEWSLEMWVEGASKVVDVVGADVYGPADVGSVDIAAADSFVAYAGSRFLFFDDGNLVGLGVIAELGD